VQVNFKIDEASFKDWENTLKKFAEIMDKSIEDGINNIARSAAKRLAHTVQPYGLNAETGKKFKKSIGLQVDRAWFGTNIGAYPETTDMRQAHYNSRVNGVVPKRQFRKEKGKPFLDLIPESERNRYEKVQIKKAGRAKGAWIECGNNLKGPKISGVAKWVNQHNDKGYGVNKFSGEGLNYKVEMTNKTPYMTRKMQSNEDIEAAMQFGRENGFKRLQIIVNKNIEKANS